MVPLTSELQLNHELSGLSPVCDNFLNSKYKEVGQVGETPLDNSQSLPLSPQASTVHRETQQR